MVDEAAKLTPAGGFVPGRGLQSGRARIAEPLLAGLLLAVVWIVLLHVGPWSDTGVTDVPVFQDYAARMLDGQVPYRDFALEYPPLAPLVFSLAGSFGTGWHPYADVFGYMMLLVAVVCLFLINELALALAVPERRRRLALVLVALTPALLGSVVRTHFDLVPVALVLGALLAAVRERPLLGFGLLGLGAATKLFPLLLVPVFAAYLWGRGSRRSAGKGIALSIAVVVVASLPFLIFDAGGYMDFFRFQGERPVQIESTPASVLLGLDAIGLDSVTVTGTTVNPDRYKSQGLEGSAAPAVGGLGGALALLVIGLATLAVARLSRRGPDPHALILVAFGVLLAGVALGKVLSPQYMIWLLPLAALIAVDGYPLPAVAVGVAGLLTFVEFPARYLDVVALETGPVLIVVVRNCALLVALGATIIAVARRVAGSAQPTVRVRRRLPRSAVH